MRWLHNYIDGGWVDSASTDRLDLVNPTTEDILASFPAGCEGDVDLAVKSGRCAASAWAARPLGDRLDVLSGAVEAIEARVEDLAKTEALEMGRPPALGRDWLNAVVEKARGDIELARTYPFTSEHGNTIVDRHALGVVALITPWNFPTFTIIDGLIPALAAGNAVVIKPSEKTPLSAVEFMRILEILPPGLVNLVLGDGRAGAPLSAHRDIGLTIFTGSVSTGRAVASANASQLRRVILELGGKDPVIVDAGVDVDAVARDVADGSFTNTGQICTSMERIFVHGDVADAFLSALVNESKRFVYGDPLATDVAMGPMVDERQREVVERHVADALQHGATALVGGRTPIGPGFFYPATVLTGVTDDMLIMRDETFGPIAPVQIVDSFDEGLAKAKGSTFGLAATVYSQDPEHINAAREIPAGLIWINKWQGAGTGVVFEPAGTSGVTSVGEHATYDALTRPSAVLHNSL